MSGAATLLAACGFLPKSGPDTQAIYSGAAAVSAPDSSTPEGHLPYVLVALEPRVLSLVSESEQFGPGLRSRGGGAGNIRPGVGDLISVTIYESGAGGLFTGDTARAGNYVELPVQSVDADGTISVPYGGRIRAAGRTMGEIQQDIENRLKNRAIEPQAIISVREQRASQVTVVGDVGQPGQFPILQSGLRLVDAISRAGGIKFAGHESQVTLQRQGMTETVPFNQIISNPSNNVYIQPKDVIYVRRDPRAFLAFGAVETGGLIEFGSDTVTLADAVGKTKGLVDSRADPSALFVYRLERRQQLERLGYSLPEFPGTLIPTIYTVNLRDPSGFFLAGQFRMRHRDIVYIGNAGSTDLSKFLVLLRQITGPILDATATTSLIFNMANKTTSIIATPTAAGP